MSGLKEYELRRFEHNNRTVVIYADPDPLNPRKEYDNIATLSCWHRRADLGDETIQHMTAKDIIKRAKDAGDRVLAILPLWLYEHSGMTIRTGTNRPGYPFTCPWDSGQVGWAYVLKSRAKAMGCVGSFTDRETGKKRKYDKAWYEDAIRGDVSTYDDYLTGACYGYEVLGQDDETLDSCWGFYCGDAGIDYVIGEAKSAAEGCEDPAVQRDADELASRVTYAGAAP